MSPEDARKVENAISDVRDALKGEDLGAIKRMTDALQQASHAMAEQMYKQTQGNSTSAQNSTPHAKDGEVIDAEVVDA
jgi:molecular chaperone DnaK